MRFRKLNVMKKQHFCLPTGLLNCFKIPALFPVSGTPFHPRPLTRSLEPFLLSRSAARSVWRQDGLLIEHEFQQVRWQIGLKTQT